MGTSYLASTSYLPSYFLPLAAYPLGLKERTGASSLSCRSLVGPGAPELCRFAIIGHGDSWESIHQEIGHRPDVNMPGVVTGEKLASLVASSDIFFSPTVTGTLDLVFIESQAAGIAVVGPRAVAVPLVVTEGVNGCLYTPLDMKDAKRAIKEVIPQLEKMKVEARKNAEANFKWSKSSDEAIQFYKDVLQYTADRAA